MGRKCGHEAGMKERVRYIADQRELWPATQGRLMAELGQHTAHPVSVLSHASHQVGHLPATAHIMADQLQGHLRLTLVSTGSVGCGKAQATVAWTGLVRCGF